MSKRVLYIVGILLTTAITCFLQWKYCCNCGISSKEEEQTNKIVTKPQVANKATKLPFVIEDVDGDLSLKTDENFNFKASSFNFMSPVAPSIDTNIETLKDYLSTHKNKTLSITGYYTKEEENNSMYPNLGYARANTVKNYIVGKGISSQVINTFSELKNDMYPDTESVYYGSINFNVTKGQDESEMINKLLKSIQDNPLEVYFDVGESRIDLTEEQRQQVVNLSRYLDKAEEARCLIIGHTDSKGKASNNQQLGLDRANFVKEQLVKNGILPNKIDVLSKGETEPIADNATETGKAKNRRTVITIK